MAQPREQVRAVLELLAKNWELVAEGLSGPVVVGERGRARQVESLAGVHALLPYEEDVFHLNPRLRAYLNDHLAFFGAFQTVTRLSEHIFRARTQWGQLKEMKSDGNYKDMEAIERGLDDTVSEIVYFMEQNLVLLNAQMFTRYGNVTSLKAKKAQNRFYGQEVKNCLRELQSVDKLVEQIGSEAMGAGLPGARQLVNGRLRSRLSGWVARLNDIQAVITRRLFLAKQLEQRVGLLSSISLWLVRNPTRSGLEVPVDEKTPLGLLRPKSMRMAPQVDFDVAAGAAEDVMAAAVARLPKMVDPAERAKQRSVQPVLAKRMEEVEETLAPEDEAIMRLLDDLRQAGRTGLSLARWKREQGSLLDVLSEEEWLLYAASQLVSAGKLVQFMETPRPVGMLNQPYYDVLALEKA